MYPMTTPRPMAIRMMTAGGSFLRVMGRPPRGDSATLGQAAGGGYCPLVPPRAGGAWGGTPKQTPNPGRVGRRSCGALAMPLGAGFAGLGGAVARIPLRRDRQRARDASGVGRVK